MKKKRITETVERVWIDIVKTNKRGHHISEVCLLALLGYKTEKREKEEFEEKYEIMNMLI